MLQILANGILLGNDYVFIGLGISLLYRHSLYIPIWLPEVGAIAAYLTYFIDKSFGLPRVSNVTLPIVLSVIIGIAIHKFLMFRFVSSRKPYEGLLVSLGISVIVVNVLAFTSGSYSLVFQSINSSWSLYIPSPIDDSIYWYDILRFFGAIIITIISWLFLKFTYQGKQVRALMANRSLADTYGVSLKIVDTLILGFVSFLVSIGGIFHALKYDLKPEMMFNLGLKSLVIVLAFRPGNIFGVILGAYVLGILETFFKQYASISLYVDAFVYGFMIVLILIHSRKGIYSVSI